MPFLEANQHPALFGDEAHCEPGLAPVTKFSTADNSQFAIVAAAYRMLQTFMQNAFLEGKLGAGGVMLKAAATTVLKEGTQRGNPFGRSLQYLKGLRLGIAAPAVGKRCTHSFARQRTVDEHDPALVAGQTAPLMAQFFDFQHLRFPWQGTAVFIAPHALAAQLLNTPVER